MRFGRGLRGAVPVAILLVAALAAPRHGQARPDGIAVALRLVQEVYVEPPKLNDAWYSVSTDPFGSQCGMMGLTVRLTDKHGSGRRMLLDVSFQFVNGELEFMSAEGPARQRVGAGSWTSDAIRILQRELGWAGAAVERPRKQRPDRQYFRIRKKSAVFDAQLTKPIGIGHHGGPVIRAEN